MRLQQVFLGNLVHASQALGVLALDGHQEVAKGLDARVGGAAVFGKVTGLADFGGILHLLQDLIDACGKLIHPPFERLHCGVLVGLFGLFHYRGGIFDLVAHGCFLLENCGGFFLCRLFNRRACFSVCRAL